MSDSEAMSGEDYFDEEDYVDEEEEEEGYDFAGDDDDEAEDDLNQDEIPFQEGALSQLPFTFAFCLGHHANSIEKICLPPNTDVRLSVQTTV
jgi:hypothetical protein